MVASRRSVAVAAARVVAAEQQDAEDAARPAAKRRRVAKAVVVQVDAEATPGETPAKRKRAARAAVARVSVTDAGDQGQATPAKRKGSAKKAKKLLDTLHTEETLPALRLKAAKIYDHLMELYKDPPCPLAHDSPFQLLVAVILSAQSTDKKVNEITPALFAAAPDAAAMAVLEVPEIERHIRQIGLAPTKARNISATSKALVERHGGCVPASFEALEQLAGVGHKTASVVLAQAFQLPTFPVDTHIYRLGVRWGLTAGKTVEQAEADLKVCWPEERWNALHLRVIYFGREHCPAQRHDAADCPICSWAAAR